MKIYTKTGDQGETSLGNGTRIEKSALRIDTYGTVDELIAQIGYARTLDPGEEIGAELLSLQKELCTLGADLAVPVAGTASSIVRISETHVTRIEASIDRLDARMPVLQYFILPSGTTLAAQLHIARTVCRRAERLADALGRQESIGSVPLKYLNRLSDLLFVLARYANYLAGVEETLWHNE